MDASWQRLGDAAGIRDVGVNRVASLRASCRRRRTRTARPRSCTSCSQARASRGRTNEVHEVRAARLRHPPRELAEHTFVAGPEGLEYLVFGHGTRRRSAGCRARARSGSVAVGRGARRRPVGHRGGRRRCSSTVSRSPRPENIVNVDEVELEDDGTTDDRAACDERALVQAGLHWEQFAAGKRGLVPHCHSEEEEVFVILDGEGRSSSGRRRSRKSAVARAEDIPIRAGHLIARPPGTGISHSFLAGGTGLTMLIFGTRRPTTCSGTRARRRSSGAASA